MVRNELAIRVEHLIAQRQPVVLATVVRARRPTSVRPGDAAVVLSDDTIEGFVGGVCGASPIRLQSLRALETGDPLRLRLVPGDGADGGGREPIDGAVVERNPCLSGGALEIFLEPHRPAARVVIAGDSPIAHSLKRVGEAAGKCAFHQLLCVLGCGTDEVRRRADFDGVTVVENPHFGDGCSKLLDRHAPAVVDVPVDERIPVDVDTWDDYRSVLASR